MVELIEIEPGRWRVKKPALIPASERTAAPDVISDTMPETEQVDGRFYTSKAAFRAVGRRLGLTEVGTEKLKHNVKRASTTRAAKEGRIQALKKAMEQGSCRVSQAKQKRFMAAAAHSPKFAKKAGISQTVAKEFHSADQARRHEERPVTLTGSAQNCAK